jgi:hypothetical protein
MVLGRGAMAAFAITWSMWVMAVWRWASDTAEAAEVDEVLSRLTRRSRDEGPVGRAFKSSY